MHMPPAYLGSLMYRTSSPNVFFWYSIHAPVATSSLFGRILPSFTRCGIPPAIVLARRLVTT